MEQNGNTTTIPMVGSDKKETGKVLKVVIVVTSIIAVCGIGFGVYGVIQNFSKDDQISDLKKQLNGAIAAEPSVDSPSTEGSASKVDVATDKYKDFADNLSKNNNKNVAGSYEHWNGSSFDTRWVVAHIENSHLSIKEANEGPIPRSVSDDAVIIAETDGVIDVQFITLGNGGVPYMYFIKKDGSVARVNINDEDPEARVIENLDGYGKIVSISQVRDDIGQGNAQLVDIDGNVYKSVI